MSHSISQSVPCRDVSVRAFLLWVALFISAVVVVASMLSGDAATTMGLHNASIELLLMALVSAMAYQAKTCSKTSPTMSRIKSLINLSLFLLPVAMIVTGIFAFVDTADFPQVLHTGLQNEGEMMLAAHVAIGWMLGGVMCAGLLLNVTRFTGLFIRRSKA